jgi:hypothetical protein
VTRRLLATADAGGLFSDVAPWLALLAGLCILGFIVMIWIRRSIHDEASSAAPGFTLQDLRDLRAAGELSEEEFERARAGMIARLTEPREESGNETEGTPQKPDKPDD